MLIFGSNLQLCRVSSVFSNWAWDYPFKFPAALYFSKKHLKVSFHGLVSVEDWRLGSPTKLKFCLLLCVSDKWVSVPLNRSRRWCSRAGEGGERRAGGGPLCPPHSCKLNGRWNTDAGTVLLEPRCSAAETKKWIYRNTGAPAGLLTGI